MWKRFINFLMIGLLLYGLIFIFSQNDQRSNRVRLNNNSLSTTALVFSSRSNTTLKEALTEIEKKAKKNDQFQFQFMTNNKVVFVYAHGYMMNLPLTSGRNFNNEDFLTTVPLALVGKDVKKNLYLTSNENYYKLGKQYISVIGETGSNETNKLNRKIFISINSSNLPQNPKLRDLTIVGDGPKVVDKTKEFRHIFHAFKEHKYLYSEIPLIGSGWLRHSWLFFLMIIVIFILLIVLFDYQFELGIQKFHKWSSLKIIFLDLLLVTLVLWIGLKTQYIMNHYFLIFFIYSLTILGIGISRYLLPYQLLKNEFTK